MEDVRTTLVKELLDTANDYCACVEQASGSDPAEVLGKLQFLLPLVYHKAAGISQPKYCYDEDIKKFVSDSRYASIRDSMEELIKTITDRIPVAAGTKHDQSEHISFSLSEAIADVYESLKEFTSLYQVGIPQSMNDAIWILKKDFEANFGLRLTEGLQLLHMLIYNSTNIISTSPGASMDREEPGDDRPWYSDDQEEIYSEDE